MNGVDVGDQLRASNDWEHRWCGRPSDVWQPLAWGFLLSTACVNSYLLDNTFGTWKDSKKSHLEWREALVSQLFNTYALRAESQKRGRPGRFDNRRNDSIKLSLHKEGNRDGKRAHCVICLALKRKARKPLGDIGLRANI